MYRASLGKRADYFCVARSRGKPIQLSISFYGAESMWKAERRTFERWLRASREGIAHFARKKRSEHFSGGRRSRHDKRGRALDQSAGRESNCKCSESVNAFAQPSSGACHTGPHRAQNRKRGEESGIFSRIP